MISFDKFFDTVPQVEYFPSFDPTGERDGVSFEGIKALAYEGADYKGSKTKVFAHIGFPENVREIVPAVVLIHGGGGHPDDIWIKKWNERGYAAISMDTTGYFPVKSIPHLYEGFSDGLERRLVPPFYEEGYTVGPDNTCMNDCQENIGDRWIYHAVASVILAFNILKNDSRVDSTKIGMCGISWGGIIASTVMGYDSRFAFAIPIYGSGFARESLTYFKEIYSLRANICWLPEINFPQVKMPVMWLCWNDDCNFSINGNSMSYLATRVNNKNTCLSMIHNMRHSHNEGYTPEESYWFADCIINGRDVPSVNAEYSDGFVKYYCSEKIKSVRLFYITEKMTYVLREKHRDKNFYMAQDWNILELPADKTSAVLPGNAVGRYVEFTLENGIVLTTSYVQEETE